MRTIPRLLLALALLALAPLAGAQTLSTFARNYDLQATSYTYCVTTPKLPGNFLIKTTGSSTTTDAVSGTPFASLAVGDDVWAVPTATTAEARRSVTTASSATSIVVNSAWDLGTTGVKWFYAHRTCGTTATDGWIERSPKTHADVKVEFATLTGTGGVDVSIECRYAGDATLAAQVYTANYTSATAPTNSDVIPIGERCTSLRVGLKWGTANVGTDSISAYLYTESVQ